MTLYNDNKNILNVVIIVACCHKTGNNFGIRFEEKSTNNWVGDWAFPIKKHIIKKEKYENTLISGNFSFSADYHGCPYCESQNIFKCSCGKINCWDGKIKIVTCKWCNGKGELSVGAFESLDSSNDL